MPDLPLTTKEVLDSGVKSRYQARQMAAKNRASLPKKTTEERIANLDIIFGKNKGAQRERARLVARGGK